MRQKKNMEVVHVRVAILAILIIKNDQPVIKLIRDINA